MEPAVVLVLGATGRLPEMLSERLRGLNVRLRYTGGRAPAIEHLAESRPTLILLNSAMVRWQG
ncbi:MAG: hypothetical protein M3Z13_05330, partial [Candidatus Dormibacteraeota bacterium]|nr:hypothetical protein [Candidatus Dormibacteraeota bacterium]